MKLPSVLVSAIVVAGCATANLTQQRRELSAGHAGCPPQEIAVSEETNLSWKATCHGEIYYCSGGTSIQCKQASAPVVPPAP